MVGGGGGGGKPVGKPVGVVRGARWVNVSPSEKDMWHGEAEGVPLEKGGGGGGGGESWDLPYTTTSYGEPPPPPHLKRGVQSLSVFIPGLSPPDEAVNPSQSLSMCSPPTPLHCVYGQTR